MAQPRTLTPTEIARFERDGFVVVREAFARADALAMQRRWWQELRDVHGIRRDDRTTWHRIAGDLRAAKRDPLQHAILTDRLRGAVDDLLGPGAWAPPRDWGRCLVTFPEPGRWDVPTGLWHWDNPPELHRDRPRGLFVVGFVGTVEPGGGGTLVLSGSPRLLLQQERDLPADELPVSGVRRWSRFHRSHPWLRALTGHAPAAADRTAAFMAGETDVDGVPLRVVELTGEPGDVVLCHPLVVHCAAPNRGDRPRFMRIKTQVLAHDARRAAAQPAP
jgi:hypothetical protein